VLIQPQEAVDVRPEVNDIQKPSVAFDSVPFSLSDRSVRQARGLWREQRI